MTTTCRILFASGTWTGAQIKSAKIVEQISPLSTELHMNTLEFTLHSDAGEFSVVSATGTLASMQYREPINVYESINDEEVFMGKFYLDTWESLSEDEARFTAVDAIGLMDKE